MFSFKFNLNPQTILYIAAPIIYIVYVVATEGGSKEISWCEFRNNLLEKGLVDKIVIVNKSIARVFLKPESQLGRQDGRYLLILMLVVLRHTTSRSDLSKHLNIT